MGKLFRLIATAGVLAGAGYYLTKKGILKVNTESTEDGARVEFEINMPKASEEIEAKSEEAAADDEKTETAEPETPAEIPEEKAEEPSGESAKGSDEEIDRNIDSLLKELDQ